VASFFPFIEQVMDNQRHHEHLNKHKGNIAYEVEEDMVCIMEYQVMENIKENRQKHHYNTRNDSPINYSIHINAFHKSVRTDTLNSQWSYLDPEKRPDHHTNQETNARNAKPSIRMVFTDFVTRSIQ
jgi:hypothetical protein